MFVLKEMLPSYHKWRYNSHGVREQIGKENVGREGLGNFWVPGDLSFPFGNKSHHSRPHHSSVFSGVQVAWSWSWFTRYWTCAMRQTCTAGMRGRLLEPGAPGCYHLAREVWASAMQSHLILPQVESRATSRGSDLLHWTVLPFLPVGRDDADSGPRGPCVVAAVNKFTQTTEVLWRKRDGMAAL